MNTLQIVIDKKVEQYGIPKSKEALSLFMGKCVKDYVQVLQIRNKGLQEVAQLVNILESEDTGESGSVTLSDGEVVTVESKNFKTAEELLKLIKK